MFCEEHRKFYVQEGIPQYEGFPVCCGSLFEEEPFFSPAGTCFTSKVQIKETFPSINSNIRMWLSTRKEISPGEWRP